MIFFWVLIAVGPRKNLAFTSLANMINEGNDHGCPWRAVDEDTGTFLCLSFMLNLIVYFEWLCRPETSKTHVRG